MNDRGISPTSALEHSSPYEHIPIPPYAQQNNRTHMRGMLCMACNAREDISRNVAMSAQQAVNVTRTGGNTAEGPRYANNTRRHAARGSYNERGFYRELGDQLKCQRNKDYALL